MRFFWFWTHLNRGLFWLCISMGLVFLLPITAQPMKQQLLPLLQGLSACLPSQILAYAASWVIRSSVNWMQNIPTLALWWAEWWPKGSRTLHGFSAVRLEMPTYATKQLFWMWMCSCGALHVLSVLCGPHSGVCKTLQLGSACVLRSLGVALGPAGEAVCTDFLFCARGEVLSWGGVLDDWGAVCRLAPECKVLPEDGRRAGGGKRLWLVLRFRLVKAAG